MKHILVLLCSFVVFSNAQALSKIYGYDYWVPKTAKEYLTLVDRNSPAQGAPSCQHMYSGMLRDDVLDVRYAFGYFDDSTGQEHVSEGVNWGYSPSLDIVMFESMRKTLTARCSSRTQRLCEFDEQGDPNGGRLVYHKYMSFHGRRVLVRITLTHASASEFFERNKTDLADRQKALTLQSEENFFGGLKRADIVFYNGHSRNGGGPDFTLPVLTAEKKTNYKGYYEIKKAGIKRTMAALALNPDEGPVVGFFSCYARLHFYDTFMKANPKQKVILSEDTINYMDAFEGSLGYLEGMLRGSCGQELNDTARQVEKIRRGFEGYNLN
jgi:hypothetical protein